ncbi:hypothetical protein EGW08_000967 [Elysia chlorotica]|uniref:G-protein coupled receptors family 2 profile 2 domain-containing protein n=1 Tax=Elysia chlorotica TaxID=188477 RepID=A0A3S1A0E6_ELYCH|nr:hypothetical protein EGW08_000967 [Elysia chlorotica]
MNDILNAFVVSFIALSFEIQFGHQPNQVKTRLVSDMEKFGEKVDMGNDPVVRHVTPNVAMELWSMEDAGEDVVIGMGATETSSWSAPLSDPRIVTIKNRAWADENLPNFDIAIELPESLVRNTIRYSDTALRLSMFIYRKSSLFVGNDHLDPGRGDLNPLAPPGEVNSAIISASLGGRRVQGLQEKIRLVFKPIKTPEEDDGWDTHCVYWDDGSGKGSSGSRRAHWSGQGCVYNGTWNGRHVCLCDHLTNFAVLLDFYGESRAVSASHQTSLTVITLVGLSLSIFGLAMTVVTFVAFNLMYVYIILSAENCAMAIALLCFQLVFMFGVKATSVWPICLLVAVLLHYLILVSFAWMLIEAVLQYLTFVKVLGTYISRYTLKTVLPAWGVPLLPVAAVLFTDYNLYIGRTDYCWMDLQAFYYAFALPVGVIIVFNLVMFLVIIASLVTRPKGLRSNQAASKARETNLKAAFTIFILLGLTWIFGFLAVEDARVPFQYAFTVFSSLQGFLIFVLMVVRRRQVRDQWRQMCCVPSERQPRRQKKLSPASSSSTSSSHSVSNSRTLPSFINHIYSGGDPDTIIPPFPLPPPALKRQPSIHV